MKTKNIFRIAYGIEDAMTCNSCPASDVCNLSVQKCPEWIADWIWGILNDNK